METGSNDQYAHYISGNSSAKLNFNYNIKLGDNSSDLSYTSINSLNLSGVTIKDLYGNDASLILPEPGNLKSLDGNKDIKIKSWRGNLVYKTATSGYNHPAYPEDLIIDKYTQNVYLLGKTRGSIDGATKLSGTFEYDIFLSKFSSSGEKLWTNHLPNDWDYNHQAHSCNRNNAFTIDKNENIFI